MATATPRFQLVELDSSFCFPYAVVDTVTGDHHELGDAVKAEAARARREKLRPALEAAEQWPRNERGLLPKTELPDCAPAGAHKLFDAARAAGWQRVCWMLLDNDRGPYLTIQVGRNAPMAMQKFEATWHSRDAASLRQWSIHETAGPRDEPYGPVLFNHPSARYFAPTSIKAVLAAIEAHPMPAETTADRTGVDGGLVAAPVEGAGATTGGAAAS